MKKKLIVRLHRYASIPPGVPPGNGNSSNKDLHAIDNMLSSHCLEKIHSTVILLVELDNCEDREQCDCVDGVSVCCERREKMRTHIINIIIEVLKHIRAHATILNSEYVNRHVHMQYNCTNHNQSTVEYLMVCMPKSAESESLELV